MFPFIVVLKAKAVKSTDSLLEGALILIEKNGGKILGSDHNMIRFKGSSLASWKMFAMVGEASLSVDDRKMTLKMSLVWMFIGAFFISTAFFYVSKNPYVGAAAFVAFGVINWIIVIIRSYWFLAELNSMPDNNPDGV